MPPVHSMWLPKTAGREHPTAIQEQKAGGFKGGGPKPEPSEGNKDSVELVDTVGPEQNAEGRLL